MWETWLLMTALARRLSGRRAEGVLLEYPYLPETESPRSPALRAFMTYGVCVSPNSYLVDIDMRKRVVSIRQLVGQEVSPVDKAFLELR